MEWLPTPLLPLRTKYKIEQAPQLLGASQLPPLVLLSSYDSLRHVPPALFQQHLLAVHLDYKGIYELKLLLNVNITEQEYANKRLTSNYNLYGSH